MKVRVEEVRKLMSGALTKKGYKSKDIDFIINMYLGGELRGHTSHGLASFSGFLTKDYSKLPKPNVIKKTNSVFMIDAKGWSGTIVGRRAADEAMAIAKKEVVGTAIIKNMDFWLRPGGIAEYVVDKGYLVIVTNDGGGNSIAPPGGFDPTLGTNPIAYGIPTAEEPLVVDMALSKRAWGQVRLAHKYGTLLPADTYYNDKGKVTLDPTEAYSVKPAGDYKGFALGVLVEILSLSLVGMPLMTEATDGSTFAGITNSPKRGGVIIVFDPSQTTDLKTFKRANTAMLKRIQAGQALPGKKIRIPGYDSAKKQNIGLESNELEVADEVWEELQTLK